MGNNAGASGKIEITAAGVHSRVGVIARVSRHHQSFAHHANGVRAFDFRTWRESTYRVAEAVAVKAWIVSTITEHDALDSAVLPLEHSPTSIL